MSEPLRVLSLFAGIGGFDLGLERTGGFKTVAFCEIDPFCRRVLAKHWPEVPCYHDVRELTAERLAADGVTIECIVGGFPCQDISTAGKGAGLAGERSGLWREYARLIGEIRPSYVIVENVAALLSRGLGTVLGDLAALGYDAEWHCIPASAVGAPHRRDRIWVMAHPDPCLHAGGLVPGAHCSAPSGSQSGNDGERQTFHGQRVRFEFSTSGPDVADAPVVQRNGGKHNRRRNSKGAVSLPQSRDGRCDANVADAEQRRLATGNEQYHGGHPILLAPRSCERGRNQFWETWRVEPDVGRVAYGVPAQMDRLQSLGNAVVPQIPELIGGAILAAIADTHAKRGDAPQIAAPSLMSGGGAGTAIAQDQSETS